VAQLPSEPGWLVCGECDGAYMKGMHIAPAGCGRGFSPTLLGRIGDMREGISPLATPHT